MLILTRVYIVFSFTIRSTYIIDLNISKRYSSQFYSNKYYNLN